jgi:hypothetical protein
VHILVGVLGFVLLLAILWDAFESVVLPRHVRRKVRIVRGFFLLWWTLWRAFARLIRSGKRRESYLSYFGPLVVLLLLVFWASALVLAFAMVQWAAGSALISTGISSSFGTDLYFSGSAFFTLGLGDVTPSTGFARALSVIESGTGFGFLAIVIAYLPMLYGAFSQREVNISLLDARAGSPPTAAELLRRHGRKRIADGLSEYLRDWEIWSAQLMETHLTYPFLCYFRSQHDNQSWLAAFTAVLDTSALLIAYGEGETKWQAQLTFAISRHAVADLSQVFNVRPRALRLDRLPAEDLPRVRALLVQCGVPGCTDAGDRKLNELRLLYEPYLNGLSKRLLMPLPPWGVEVPAGRAITVWDRIVSTQAGPAPGESVEADHL